MFEVGDYIVCVNDRPMDPPFVFPPPTFLKKSKVYRVKDVQGNLVDIGYTDLRGKPWLLYENRFIKLDDTGTTGGPDLLKSLVVEIPILETEMS